MIPRAPAAALLVSLLMLLPGAVAGRAPAHPQERSAPARLVAFTNEPREPEFGAVFELRLTVRIAPALVVFFPDTLLPEDAAVSAGAGSWLAVPGPADSLDVQATYPVMGLLNGGVQLPALELWVRPAAVGETGGLRPARELGAAGPSSVAELERVLIPVGGALIMPFEELVQAEGPAPRPAADVLGGEWSIWLLAMIGTVGLSVVILGWLLVSARRHARTGAPGVPRPSLSPRLEALNELDRIRGLGWHTNGRLVDFYDATTGVLRHFSEREEPLWRTALTSTELLGRMQIRWGPSSVEELRSAVWAAECVKFGGLTPGPEAAEEDWSTIRDWIDRMPGD